MNNALPVHFLTIVLNGMPFIRYHVDVFSKLPFRWHWHIVEGVADLVGDTAWSLRNGGKIADNLHKEGSSNDGTTQYLDALAAKFPESITIYRKPCNVFWHGKLEMVQRPLSTIQEECLLWQIDVDELWTAEQLTKGHALFCKHPGKTAAFYYCSFFVGPALIVTTLDTYGNYSRSEWLRTWHFMPGDCWQSHEPPQLVRKSANGKTFNVGFANPFKQAETSGNGLIFQHYAYATEPQARFKRDYYGYDDAVTQWKLLQSQKHFPVKLKEYFSWVNDEAMVDRAAEQGIIPLIDLSTTRGVTENKDIATAENILWLRTDAIGDNILASSMLPHFRRHAPRAKIHIVCQEHIAELYDHCPYADTVQVIPSEHRWKDENQMNAFIGQLRALKPDLLINSIYSVHALSDLPHLEFVRRRVAMRPSSLVCYDTFVETPAGNLGELERYSLFLNGLGIEAGEPLEPMLWLSEEDNSFAKELFDKNGLDPSNTIALFTSARTRMKQYSRWPEVLSHLYEKNEVAIVYLGGEADHAFGEELRQAAPIKFVNVCGQVGLRRAAAILKRALLAVGVDTALAHMACAMQTNNVVLLGGGHFGRFLPYSPRTSVVCQPLSCYGCDWNCRYEKSHCIETISPRAVAYAIQMAFQAQGDKSRIYVDRSVDKQDIIPARQLEYYGRWIDAHKHQVIEVTNDVFTNSHAMNNSAQCISYQKLPRNLPLISIITPSFNQVSYLEACIRSVIEQDYPNFQYIVMDGGSTDGSREIIEKYAHNLYYWQSQPDNGHYWAVQEGINRSNGEIVTWLNSDDLFHPHAFKYAAAIFMQRNDVHWLTGRPNSMNADGSDLFVLAQLPLWSRKRYLEKRYHHPFIQQEGTFWRRTLWEKAGAMMQSGLKLAADLELWNRFFKYADLHSVDFPFAAYRVQGENRAIRFMPLYMKEAEQVVDNEIKSFESGEQKRLRPPPIPITRAQIAKYVDMISSLNKKISEFDDSEHCNISVAKAQRTPLITSIVSTYNSERFIRGCLEDLLAQTIADQIEIIVIDSASEQGEGNITREFQRKYGRIHYFRTEKRESVYAAWNRGIQLAKGKYITNANTDDRHRPDAFEKMVAVLEADPKTVLVYADVIKTQTPNQTMAACTPTGVLRWFDWQRGRLLSKGCFIGPQPMWRRNVHDRFGFFDEKMTVAADYEYWLRISQLFDFRRISEPLGLYLERDDSVEHAHHEKKRAEERMIHERYSAAVAAGKILSFAPLESLRRGAQRCQREIMRQALADIESISQYVTDGAAAGVQALCTELAAALAQDAEVTEDRVERFIHEASHYFLTRGAAPLAKATQVNDREANRTLRDSSQEGVPMMPFAEKIQQGVRCLLDGGHIESAQWMLDKLLADYPDHAPAHHERAMLAHHQGDVNKAGMHFRKAAELAPVDATFQKSLGDFYHVAQKNTDAAFAQYQKVLELVPNDIDTLLITGHLCTASHRFDEAQTYYQTVLRLVPNHPDARQMLNRLSMRQAAPQPKVSPESLYQSACRQAEQGQGLEAAHTLEQLIALDPGHALAHNDLGVLAFESGDKDKAQRMYEKACELAPYNGVFQKNLGDFYYLELGDAKKALSRYVQALTLDPRDVESLMGTGHICMGLGRFDDALDFFNLTLEIEPWHAEARIYLQKLEAASLPAAGAITPPDLYVVAQSQAAAGDPEEAIRTLEQLVAKEPNHAQAYNDLGVLYYEQGDKVQALRFYEQAARLAPHEATFLKNLADFYFVEQGRTKEALPIYIRVLESNREDVECLMATGTICLSLDKNDDARTFFERVLEIDPWHAEACEKLNRIGNERSGGYGDYIATLGQRRVGSA